MNEEAITKFIKSLKFKTLAKVFPSVKSKFPGITKAIVQRLLKGKLFMILDLLRLKTIKNI